MTLSCERNWLISIISTTKLFSSQVTWHLHFLPFHLWIRHWYYAISDLIRQRYLNVLCHFISTIWYDWYINWTNRTISIYAERLNMFYIELVKAYQCMTRALMSNDCYCPWCMSTWQSNMNCRYQYSISQEICTQFCCALLCCGYTIVHNEFTWSIYPYSSGLLCWHWGNR